MVEGGSIYNKIKDESGLTGTGVDFSNKLKFNRINNSTFAGAFAPSGNNDFEYSFNDSGIYATGSDVNDSDIVAIPRGTHTSRLSGIITKTLDDLSLKYIPGAND
jgi:hypothetical protein